VTQLESAGSKAMPNAGLTMKPPARKVEGAGVVLAQKCGERGEGHGHAVRQVQHRGAHRHLFQAAGTELEAVHGIAVVQLAHARRVVGLAAGRTAALAQFVGRDVEGEVVDLTIRRELYVWVALVGWKGRAVSYSSSRPLIR
jgi:hypothetical protein